MANTIAGPWPSPPSGINCWTFRAISRSFRIKQHRIQRPAIRRGHHAHHEPAGHEADPVRRTTPTRSSAFPRRSIKGTVYVKGPAPTRRRRRATQPPLQIARPVTDRSRPLFLSPGQRLSAVGGSAQDRGNPPTRSTGPTCGHAIPNCGGPRPQPGPRKAPKWLEGTTGNQRAAHPGHGGRNPPPNQGPAQNPRRAEGQPEPVWQRH